MKIEIIFSIIFLFLSAVLAIFFLLLNSQSEKPYLFQSWHKSELSSSNCVCFLSGIAFGA